jgi:hypothetical protein
LANFGQRNCKQNAGACGARANPPLYFAILRKHVIAVKAMPPEAVAADQGMRLANEYAAVKREIDSLQERFAKIRTRFLNMSASSG